MISKKEFERYNNEKNADRCLEISDTPKLRVTDEQAKRIIRTPYSEQQRQTEKLLNS